MKNLTIATRKSPLALYQANYVKQKLVKHHKNLIIKLLTMTTEGDIRLGGALAEIGGKGLFIKELELGIQQGLADIAVHSMKDVPYSLPDGFTIGVILVRENPFDAFVSNNYSTIYKLPNGAKVGTCSLRRKVQLLALRPDLKIIDLRGNVNTRLKKLDYGNYDAIILACAGLIRLGLSNRIKQVIPKEQILPAVGQGAIGIEIKTNDTKIAELIKPLLDKNTSITVLAERAMNKTLGGSCTSPIACYGYIKNNLLCLSGLVGDIKTNKIIKKTLTDSIDKPEELGIKLANELLVMGADAMLK